MSKNVYEKRSTKGDKVTWEWEPKNPLKIYPASSQSAATQVTHLKIFTDDRNNDKVPKPNSDVLFFIAKTQKKISKPI